MKAKYYFGTLGELKEGQFVIRAVGNHSVGATLLKGEPLLILNYCPHAGAPICQGKIGPKLIYSASEGLQLDTQNPVVRCPWHGWEFNLEDGRTSNFDSRLRLSKIQYELESEALYIWL